MDARALPRENGLTCKQEFLPVLAAQDRSPKNADQLCETVIDAFLQDAFREMNRHKDRQIFDVVAVSGEQLSKLVQTAAGQLNHCQYRISRITKSVARSRQE